MRSGAPLLRISGGAAVFSIGFFPLFAQALLLRFFLTEFEGHEFALGCFFGSWLIWLGAGSLLARRAAADEAPHIRWDLLLPAYIPAWIIQYLLLVNARQLAGVQPYEFFPLAGVLAVTLLANAPLSLLTGALFTLACLPAAGRQPPLARVYAFECLGSFAGGASAALLLARGVALETAALGAALPVCAAALCHGIAAGRRRAAALPLLLCALCLGGVLAGAGRDLAAIRQAAAFARLLPGGRLAGAFSTGQGTYLFGFYRGQFNVIAGGAPCETIPEQERASEIIAAHLAQKPDARDVLVIGPGTFALCRRLLDLPQAGRVAWLHTDPQYPAELLRVLPADLRAGAEKIEAPPLEIREALNRQHAAYDLIIVSLPDAATLSLNRYFTAEFFALAKKSLRPGGVLSVRISGGENYLGGDLAMLGASAFKNLQACFQRLALKPGDDTWLMASDSAPLADDPGELSRRFASVAGSASFYPREAVAALYPADRIGMQMSLYRRTIKKSPEGLLANTDGQPRALLHALLLTAAQAGSGASWSPKIKALALAGGRIMLAWFAIFALLRTMYILRRPEPSGSLPAAPVFLIASTGFAAMALSVVLMFLYQVRFGTLASRVGLLSALFMLGLFAGSRLVEAALAARPGSAPGLLRAGLAAHIGLLALASRMTGDVPPLAFWLALPAAGMLTGAYVPIAALCLGLSPGVRGRAAGVVFLIADNLGAAAGGMLAALILVPALGAGPALLPLGLLLGMNFFFFSARSFAACRAPSADRLDRFVRPAGYLLFGAAACWLAAGHLLQASAPEKKDPPLLAAALAMLRATGLQPDRPGGRQDAEPAYYEVKSQDGKKDSLVFSTAAYGPPATGYGGPLVLAVRSSPAGRVLDLRIIDSRETPAYLARVRPWLASLAGRDLARENWAIDGVSGATATCDAALKSLQAAGPRFAADVLKAAAPQAAAPPLVQKPWDWRVTVFTGLLLLGLFSHYRPGRLTRLLCLIAALCAAGLLLNVQFSLDQVFSLAGLKLPPAGFTLPFLACLLIPALVLLAGNIYCGYLCPFGALQELIAGLRPRAMRWTPPRNIVRYTRCLKYLLLAAALFWFGAELEPGLSSADPLVTAFSRDALARPPLLVMALVALSFFFNRFWCRNLCPAGAFLSLLGGAGLLSRFFPGPQPARCDLGVRSARELDCLRCDRCIIAGVTQSLPSGNVSSGLARALTIAYIVAVLAAGYALVQRGRAAHEDWVSRQPAAAATPTRSEKEDHPSRPARMPAIRQLIEQGQLSGREALHYKPYVPPADADQ